MNTLDTVGLIAVVIVLVLVRSLTWRAVRPGKLLTMPAILGVLGLALVGQTIASLGGGWRPSATDVVVLVGELAVAVVAGWAMGRLSVFRTVDGVVSSRLRPGGAAVFLGFVAVRVLVALLATTVGGTAALLSASVLIMIAVVKLTQGLVVSGRYRQHLAQAPATPAVTGRSVQEPSYR